MKNQFNSMVSRPRHQEKCTISGENPPQISPLLQPTDTVVNVGNYAPSPLIPSLVELTGFLPFTFSSISQSLNLGFYALPTRSPVSSGS